MRKPNSFLVSEVDASGLLRAIFSPKSGLGMEEGALIMGCCRQLCFANLQPIRRKWSFLKHPFSFQIGDIGEGTHGVSSGLFPIPLRVTFPLEVTWTEWWNWMPQKPHQPEISPLPPPRLPPTSQEGTEAATVFRGYFPLRGGRF